MKATTSFIAASAAGAVTMLSSPAGAATCDNAGWCKIEPKSFYSQGVIYVRTLGGPYNRRRADLNVVLNGSSGATGSAKWVFDCSRSTVASADPNVAAVMGSSPAIPMWGEEVLKHVCPTQNPQASSTESPIAGAPVAPPAIAKSQIGKYSGSSTYWIPDYAGTIEVQSSGDRSFTAIVDVELKKKPPLPIHKGLNFKDAEYEIRGSATITTPFVFSVPGKLFYNCKTLNSAPVIIGDSYLKLYLGDGNEPKNTYKFLIETAGFPMNCVNEKGMPDQMLQPWTLRIETSARPYSASMDDYSNAPTLSLTPAEQAEYDRFTKDGRPSVYLSFSPALKRKLAAHDKAWQAWFATQGPMSQYYSSLSRFTNINRLKDTITVDWGSYTYTLTWDLRRVNAR